MSKDKAFPLIAIGFVVGIASIALFIAGLEMLPHSAVSAAITSQPPNIAQESKLPEDHNWLTWSRGYVYAEDTLAQWLMTVIGLLSTVATFAGLIFVVRTFNATRQTAQAALEANEQARDFFASENRPWIKITQGAIFKLDEKENLMGTELTIKNIGRTPALQIDLHATILKIEKSQLLENVQTLVEACKERNRPARNHGLFPDDISTLEALHPAIYIQGAYVLVCVTYRGSFKQETVYHTACALEHVGYRYVIVEDSFSLG